MQALRLQPHAPGHLIGERYKVAGMVGQGGFGKVYEVVDIALSVQLAFTRSQVDSPR
jgi:hypothetical protein